MDQETLRKRKSASKSSCRASGSEEPQLDGLVLVKPRVFKDDRGFFLESFSEESYSALGIDCPFVQDNHSFSQKGTIRGLHYQSDPGQDKLLRVAYGTVYDVAVDIRPDSPTFGQWRGFILDGENHHQLFVPRGFAHGFAVLSDTAHFLYKVSAVYNPDTECGFRWDDPKVGVEWPVDDPIVSERDQAAPFFDQITWR